MDKEHRNVMIILTLFHGMQALSGYILMLAAMTYSIELLLSAITGLCIGYFMFYKQRLVLRKSLVSTSSPCCEFLDEDSEDQHQRQTSFDYSELRPNLNNENGEGASLFQRPNASLRASATLESSCCDQSG